MLLKSVSSVKIKISVLAHTHSPSAAYLIFSTFKTLCPLTSLCNPRAAIAVDVATILLQNISFATHHVLCQIAAGHRTQPALSHLRCFKIHKGNTLAGSLVLEAPLGAVHQGLVGCFAAASSCYNTISGLGHRCWEASILFLPWLEVISILL